MKFSDNIASKRLTMAGQTSNAVKFMSACLNRPILNILLVVAILCLLTDFGGIGHACAQPQSDGKDPEIIVAINNKDAPAVMRLVAHGADVNAKDRFGRTALVLAAKEDLADVVILLAEKGADMNGPGNEFSQITPLVYMVMHERLEAVRTLLRRGADVNETVGGKGTALMMATTPKCTEIMRLLIHRGAMINARDELGWTPLMGAAASGTPVAVRMLLDNGAWIDAKERDGGTALMHAACNGQVATLRLLLRRGASIHATDLQKQTVLMYAITNLASVKVLLDKGASINAKTLSGQTALMHAVWAGNADVVRELLRRGADPKAKDAEGRTALMMAQDPDREYHPKIVELLLTAGSY
jgi:ankyrin repeat protein